MLLERAELTAGSTWHAAGLLPLFNMSYTVGQLHKYSVDLYKRLPAETGQDVSFHVTGNLRLATCRDRMDEYQQVLRHREHDRRAVRDHRPRRGQGAVAAGRARRRRRHAEDRRRALPPGRRPHRAGRPHDGAAQGRARSAGAEIHEHTEVTAVARTRIRRMAAHDQQGRDRRRARRLRDRQLRAPDRAACSASTCRRSRSSTSTSSTTSRRELKAYRQGGGRELAVLRESDKSYYLREERLGWILGPYEAGAPARFADGVPESFGKSLFAGDLERLLPHVEAAQRRVPALENCGIKDIVNGPISLHAGRQPADRAGLGRARTSGSTRATASASPPPAARAGSSREWIVEGEPGIDMLAVDPRRFGPYTSKRYVVHEERGDLPQRLHDPLPGRGARATRGPRRRAPSTTS